MLALPIAAVVLAACSGSSRAQDPYARDVAEAVPTIEKATGLKFKQFPRYKVESKAQVRAFLEKLFNEEKSATDLAAQQQLLSRLGVIPDTLNLHQLMLDLLTEQVVGFYDPKTKVLYIVQGAPEDQVGFVVQHELVHALQDQYMNLDSIQNIKGDDDRVLAAQAVIEGQATLVPIQAMLGPGAELPGGWDRVRDMIRESQSSMPVFSRTPQFLQELLIFPYLSGAEFMRAFNERNPDKMPYGAAMPLSSAQIVHPRDYFATPRQAPVHVTLPAPRAGAVTYDNDMGEFTTRVALYQVLQDQNEAMRSAEGWAGDRYALIKTPQGDALAWLTVFRTAVDAAEFSHALESLAHKRYGVAEGTKTGTTLTFTAKGRTVKVWGGEVGGKPAVLYVDVPAGVSTDLFDLAKVRLN
jgi:hypothetical protein